MKKNIMETKSNHNLEKTRLPNMMVGFIVGFANALVIYVMNARQRRLPTLQPVMAHVSMISAILGNVLTLKKN